MRQFPREAHVRGEPGFLDLTPQRALFRAITDNFADKSSPGARQNSAGGDQSIETFLRPQAPNAQHQRRRLRLDLRSGQRSEIDAVISAHHIRARREQLLAEPKAAAKVAEPDLAPAPLPDIIDDPFAYGADLAKRRAVVLPDPPRPKKRMGRKPTKIDTKPELSRFRVIDGGGDKPKRA